MNDSDINVGTQQSVVAIVREDGILKGVELRRQTGATEILWARSTESTETEWQSFAAECGLSVKPAADGGTDSGRMIVVGFSSAGTVFHRASVPPAGEHEIESIVRLQAETRLPLPAEQTELAWRADPVQNGQVGVTMVVARKELLQGFVRDVMSLNPTKILLDCEGIIRAWGTVFCEHEKEAVVVSVGARSTQVCLTQNGRLSNAVILDFGLNDFSGQVETTENLSAENPEAQTEATERFTQDMRSVMDLFGFADPSQIPVFVLSDDSTVYSNLVSSLRSAGLNARIVLPNIRTLTAEDKSGIERIYDYRAAIGLGLIALDEKADELNIFENVYNRVGKERKKHWLLSPKVAAAIACVMLLTLAIVSYAIDLKSPKSIMERVEASTSEAKTDLDALVQRQRLIKMVARERPDMLALLKVINECAQLDKNKDIRQQDVLLNSVYFKKDQKVNITGQVKSNDQLYKFQENLEKHKDITEVKRTSTGKVTSKGGGSSGGPGGRPGGPPGRPPTGGGPKGKGGITFTMTFHYKNFTKKLTRAQGSKAE
ncbi:MAG: hypothetical protein JSU69_11920 [Candidatus Zixiibacteriota bacterium]|nr:MAG: hypothetical protein JSU69_11920 [candidate division Zixibacteria bacterium]